MPDHKVIVLHASDNVGICMSDIKKGDEINIQGKTICAISNIAFGHKIALKYFSKGDKIKKYGVTIGVSTSHIQSGEHVHIHNMESLYMKQFTK